ncbi:MAG: class I SAM-dependent methyltransferase [Bacillota bacterium]
MAERLYSDLVWIWPFVSPPEDYEEEVASFRKRFAGHGVRDGASVLHLGSGGGSIDFNLKRHYRVTGVDVSRAMIDYAKGINSDVEYIQGDIRDVRLGRTFDAVLLHDASAYMTSLADLTAAYRTAAAHLRPGGPMVTPPEELRTRFEQHATEVTTRVRGDIAVTTIETDFDPDPSDTWFEKTFVFLIRNRGRLTIEADTHLNGLYKLDDMLGAMREAGFEPEVSRWELSDLPLEEDYPLVTAVRRKS